MPDIIKDPSHIAPVKSAEAARAGYTLGRMRWVLAISLAAIVVIYLVMLVSWNGS